MAVLNNWQKISRVLPGQPFGNAVDGDLTISSDTTQSLTVKSCSGEAASTSLTIAAGAFTNGDVVLIHQSRGTDVGQWEINRVTSGGGSTTLTLQSALQYTYTDSGASQAQVMKIPMYNTVTVDSGDTWSATAWGGDTGGILTFAAKNLTITGSISASIKGFRYGDGFEVWDGYGYQGEGHTTTTQTQSRSYSGSGGGGGRNASGAGGSYGDANGGYGAMNDAQSGSGSIGGVADLTNLYFGGGGGGGTNYGITIKPRGGRGGGAIVIFAKEIVISGTITSNGEQGVTADDPSWSRAGGGGAGGPILIQTQKATLGSNKITAIKGAGGDGQGGAKDGGAGSNGRIAVHHSGTISGSSTPSFTDTTDATLIESLGGSFLFNMI
jgi:hypothetical protein